MKTTVDWEIVLKTFFFFSPFCAGEPIKISQFFSEEKNGNDNVNYSCLHLAINAYIGLHLITLSSNSTFALNKPR